MLPCTGLDMDFINRQILSNDTLAWNLWNCDKKLNAKQREAIELAIERNFQLIQGPPG